MFDGIISPRREKNEPQLPASGILVLNPSDIPTMASRAREEACKQHFLFNSQLFSNDQWFLAGPAVGAPMATLCLEKLVALGARRIVVYGWCGSIHPNLRIGDLFLPSSGWSEEGTSQHYPVGRPWDMSLHTELLHLLEQAASMPKFGKIWTTDALYRETREKVATYAGQGIWAVDMEFTALQAVAAFREIALAAVMLVSDELFSGRWNRGYTRKKFRSCSRQTFDVLLSFLK
jgi:uridine phosphorylase